MDVMPVGLPVRRFDDVPLPTFRDTLPLPHLLPCQHVMLRGLPHFHTQAVPFIRGGIPRALPLPTPICVVIVAERKLATLPRLCSHWFVPTRALRYRGYPPPYVPAGRQHGPSDTRTFCTGAFPNVATPRPPPTPCAPIPYAGLCVLI